MKGLSIKRLAAVATGAAMVGAALAPLAAAMDLTKSDIYGADGSPNVNIVVGGTAQLSDAVWAGNIAAKIAEKAQKSGTVSVSGEAGESGNVSVEGLKVNLMIGGSTTYENAKEYKSGESEGTSDLNSYQSTPEFPAIRLTHSNLANLYYKTATIKYAGSNYTRTFQEYVTVTGDVRFDYDSGTVPDLKMELKNENDFNYTIDLGTGIPSQESSTATSTAFTDGTNDNIRIPFFGSEYLVRTVDTTGSNDLVKLIKQENIKKYGEGEAIQSLKGKGKYAGQEMSVKVVQIVQAGTAVATYSVTFELYDAEGNKVDSRDATAGSSLEELFVDSEGDYALETILYVESVNVASTTGVGVVEMTVGTDMVQLYNNKGYPYDATDTTNIYDYKVRITKGAVSTSGDQNFAIKSISIVNANEKWSVSGTSNGPLYAPADQALTEAGKAGKHEVSFMEGSGAQGEGFAKVEFKGLESDEATTAVKLGENLITYTDSASQLHNIPYYIQLEKVTSGSSFNFDGRTLYYATDVNGANRKYFSTIADGNTMVKVNGVDLNVLCESTAFCMIADYNVATGSGTVDLNGTVFTLDSGVAGGVDAYLSADMNFTMATTPVTTSSNGADVTYLEPFNTATPFKTMYLSDGNRSAGKGGTTGAMGSEIQLKGTNDVIFKYVAYTDTSTDSGYIWLLLSANTDFVPQYSKDIWFMGTDAGLIGGTIENGIADVPFYWRSDPKFTTSAGDGTNYFIATMGIDTNEGGGADINAYIDTATNKAIALPNTNLSWYTADANYHGDQLSSRVRWLLDERSDTTLVPDKAYDDFGTKYVLSGGGLTVTIPENKRRAVMLVKGTGSSEVASGGETLEIAKGETGTTSAGTKITVSDVTYNATCGAGSAGTCVATPSTYTTQAGVSLPLVYLDTDAPFGKNVIVGGPIVNQLAAAVTGLADKLTSPGDNVAEVDGATGNIVVAGYTAADTGDAAKELIDAIDALA